MTQNGISFKNDKNLFSCICAGSVDKFVGNLMQIDQIVIYPALHTDKHSVKNTFRDLGNPRYQILGMFTKILTSNFHDNYRLLSLYNSTCEIVAMVVYFDFICYNIAYLWPVRRSCEVQGANNC